MFLCFAGEQYDALGGIDDLVFIASSLEEAKEYVENHDTKDWYQIFDTETKVVHTQTKRWSNAQNRYIVKDWERDLWSQE